MLLHGLIVGIDGLGIDGLTEIGQRRMPVMMADLFLQRFPGRFLGVLLRRISGEMAHLKAGMGREPFFDVFARMVGGLIQPQQNLAVWVILQDHLQPPHGGLTSLPVDDEATHCLSRAQMDGPLNILRLLTPGPLGY